MGILAGVVPLIIGLLACFGAYQMDIGRLSKPEAGLWPFILSMMLVACSIVLLIKEARPDNYEKFSNKSRLVFYSVCAIGIFIVMFKYLGLLTAVSALLLFQLRVVGKESWKVCILVTVIMSSAAFLLFSVWLRIPFPGLLF